MIRVFKTIEETQGLPAGTLLFKGDFHDEEESVEWFDMTTEMKSGESYSYFRMDESCVVPANEHDTKTVNDFLNFTPLNF